MILGFSDLFMVHFFYLIIDNLKKEKVIVEINHQLPDGKGEDTINEIDTILNMLSGFENISLEEEQGYINPVFKLILTNSPKDGKLLFDIIVEPYVQSTATGSSTTSI